MSSIQQSASRDTIEKQYSYHNVWSQTIIVLIAGGPGTFGMIWLAVTKHMNWLWLLVLLFLLLFFLGIWIAILNVHGKLHFMLSKEGIYIPLVWKSDNHTFIPFSEISGVEFLELQGNNIAFQVSVGTKKYAIPKSYFPLNNDFQEIVEFIQKRLPSHLWQNPR